MGGLTFIDVVGAPTPRPVPTEAAAWGGAKLEAGSDATVTATAGGRVGAGAGTEVGLPAVRAKVTVTTDQVKVVPTTWGTSLAAGAMTARTFSVAAGAAGSAAVVAGGISGGGEGRGQEREGDDDDGGVGEGGGQQPTRQQLELSNRLLNGEIERLTQELAQVR